MNYNLRKAHTSSLLFGALSCYGDFAIVTICAITNSKMFPQYMYLKTCYLSVPARRIIAHGKFRLLREDQKNVFIRRNIYSFCIKVIHSELLHRPHKTELDIFDSDSRSSDGRKIDEKFKVR
ncbi:hypothetical protein WA026_008748 [Henosepilachna vigintioctopunctata]|uniref:Uncharacterized protein n=1 Tax=Henosepilachna vigintioctopunctata TaxID=420089 RepID=A0AAW1V3V3_9CUCU